MAISKNNAQVIKQGFTEIFKDKGTVESKGSDDDGRYSEVSVKLREPLTEVHMRNILTHKAENRLPHSFDVQAEKKNAIKVTYY